MDGSAVEECALRQWEVKYVVALAEPIMIGPVAFSHCCLRCRSRQPHETSEPFGQSPLNIRLVGCRRCTVREGDSNRRQGPCILGRLRIGGAEIEEVGPASGILGAGYLACLRIEER